MSGLACPGLAGLRGIVLLLLALFGLAPGAHAEMRLSQSFHSNALNGPFEYSIYLPPGYAEETGRRYPVVYLLHGVGDNEKAWPNLGKVERIADALHARRETSGLIVVMPNGKISWYVNSAEVNGAGDYETAVMRDLIEHVDTNYRTVAERGSRAITGHSMGGFGALRLAFRHPERFVATAGLSPALWSRVTPQTRLSQRQERIFRGSFGSPFDPARFLAREPRAYLADLKASDRRPVILLYAGDDDFFGIYKSTTALFGLLRDEEIEAELRIGDGGHDWRYWRTVLPDVLKRFSQEFGFRVAAASVPSRGTGPAQVVVPDDTLDVSRAMELLPDIGGTVFVRAREACYPISRSVHIDRSNLSLIGEQGASLCLEDGVRQPVILVGSAARSVPESEHIENIRIEGLTVDGNRRGQGRGGDPESARGRPHLKNNAISIHGARRVFLDRLVLRSARSGGLVISQRSREIFASRIVFADNHFDGIAVDGGHEVFVDQFKAEGNLASGLSIDTGSGDLAFSDGLVAGNGDNGIFIRDADDTTFRGLTVRDNCTHGVFASHVVEAEPLAGSGVQRLRFSDSDFLRNGKAGFYYGSANRAPYHSAFNVVVGSRFGGNVDGPFMGNPEGIAELDRNNVFDRVMETSGPVRNPLCK